MANPTNFNIYLWTDSGAPQLTARGPHASTQTQISLILDACLVSGYGSKTAAGWTKPYQTGAYHAYKMGANSSDRYFQLYTGTPDIGKSPNPIYAVGTNLFNSMTSATAGIGSVYSKPYNHAVGWTVVDSTATTSSYRYPWFLIANSAIFYFCKPNYYSGIYSNDIVGCGDIITYDGIKRTILINNTLSSEIPTGIITGVYAPNTFTYNKEYAFLTNGPPGAVHRDVTTNSQIIRWDNPSPVVALVVAEYFNGTYDGSTNTPLIGDSSQRRMNIEKIYVVGNKNLAGVNNTTIFGELPGIGRVRSRLVQNAASRWYEDGNYFYIPGYPTPYSESLAGAAFNKTGNWYG